MSEVYSTHPLANRNKAFTIANINYQVKQMQVTPYLNAILKCVPRIHNQPRIESN